jgi:hypothetical protein
VGHTAADLLDQLPEPVGASTHRDLADDLLADLPDPIDDQLADDIAAVTARLDRLQQRRPPTIDDGFGIDL